MGIKGGTDLKRDLRERYPGVMLQEAAHPGGVESLAYTQARARVFDCMMELYYRPPYCKTGAQLVDWFYTTRIVPATSRGQIMVLVFDNQLYTPQCKAACQAKRRSRAQKIEGQVTFGLKEELPENWCVIYSQTHCPSYYPTHFQCDWYCRG